MPLKLRNTFMPAWYRARRLYGSQDLGKSASPQRADAPAYRERSGTNAAWLLFWLHRHRKLTMKRGLLFAVGVLPCAHADSLKAWVGKALASFQSALTQHHATALDPLFLRNSDAEVTTVDRHAEDEAHASDGACNDVALRAGHEHQFSNCRTNYRTSLIRRVHCASVARSWPRRPDCRFDAMVKSRRDAAFARWHHAARPPPLAGVPARGTANVHRQSNHIGRSRL